LVFYLILCYLDKLNDDLLEPIVEEYKNDIPFMDDFPHEIHRWRNNVHNNWVQESCTPETALSYTSDFYPNVNRIMQLLLCLTVGSCCVGRSFSPLRKLKTWMIIDDRVNIVPSFDVTYPQKVTQWTNKKWEHLGTARSLLLLTMSSSLMKSWNSPDFPCAALFLTRKCCFCHMIVFD
jgi:hypothetical protein